MIRLAILGAGRWGRHLIRNFHQHPHATIAAVVDPDRGRRAAVAAEVGLPDTVEFFDTWEALRDHSELATELDAIVLATPATAHYATIADALPRGYHVLCEKPLTLDYGECRTLCELAQTHNRQLVIDHTYLFNAAVQNGAKILQSGTIGQPRYGYAARVHLAPVRVDVDVVWDLVIHDISIFNHWLGATPQRVRASGTAWLQPQTPASAPIAQFPSGLADQAWVQLAYPHGVEISVHLCWSNPDKQRRLAIVGQTGTLVFDELATDSLKIYRGEMVQDEDGIWQPEHQAIEAIKFEPTEPLYSVCDHFLQAVQTNQPSHISSGEMGAELVRVLLAITRSLNHTQDWVDVTAIQAH